jgi:hypothetical protein
MVDTRPHYSQRNGRPLADGREAVASLTDKDLEAEITIAAAAPVQRARRLDTLLLEHARRTHRSQSA